MRGLQKRVLGGGRWGALADPSQATPEIPPVMAWLPQDRTQASCIPPPVVLDI